MSSIKKKLSSNIKAMRIQKGYTQEKLSQLANIDYKYLQRIEGKNPPNITLQTIDKLVKALKTTAAKLFE